MCHNHSLIYLIQLQFYNFWKWKITFYSTFNNYICRKIRGVEINMRWMNYLLKDLKKYKIIFCGKSLVENHVSRFWKRKDFGFNNWHLKWCAFLKLWDEQLTKTKGKFSSKVRMIQREKPLFVLLGTFWEVVHLGGYIYLSRWYLHKS